MRGGLIAALVAVALFACGPHYDGGGTPRPSPSTGPGLGFDLAVNEKTPTTTLRVGQKLEAVLRANPGTTPWNGVRSSDQSVLAPIVNPAATAPRRVTLAAFQAIATGKAQITATAGADCSPGQACPQYAVLLTIDIKVLGG